MKLQLFAGTLVCLAMMSTAQAVTCPEVSVTDTGGAEDLKFTAARIKDGKNLICQQDGKNNLGATTVLRSEKKIKPTGPNWNNNECTVTDGDAKKCSVKL